MEHCSRDSKVGQLLGEFHALHTEDFPNYQEARKKEWSMCQIVAAYRKHPQIELHLELALM